MSNPYTIVLWCADTTRLTSLVAAHLLSEGIVAANIGRLDDEIPVAVGVANARRWPVFSRAVSERGIIRARQPIINSAERHDYLLTVTSGDEVDAASAPPKIAHAEVIDVRRLASALESSSPSRLDKQHLLEVFESLSREPRHVSGSRGAKIEVPEIADLCQRVVMALAR